jgi:hypothetical protein
MTDRAALKLVWVFEDGQYIRSEWQLVDEQNHAEGQSDLSKRAS